MWRWLQRVVEPGAAITDIGERRRARALTSIVFAIVPLGLVTVFFQLLTRPDFAATFVSNSMGLVLLGVLGALGRTRHYRFAAGAAVLVIVAICAAAGLNDPDDPVWWAYGVLAVLLATVLISIRGAAMVAVAAFGATVLVEVANGFTVGRLVGPAMFHVVVSPVLLVLAHYRNLIERDRQAQLAIHQDLLERAQRLAQMAHWRWHPARDVLEVPQPLAELLDIPAGSGDIEALVTCFDEDERQDLREALAELDEHPLAMELAFTRRDGVRRFSVLRAQRQLQDEAPVVVGSVQDVTERALADRERHVLQEHLHDAQRMETVGRIAGGIAHDFNNLLTVIMASTQLARGADGDALGEILDDIHGASERGSLLTQQLLAYARKQVLTPKRLDLWEVLTSMRPILERVASRRALHIDRAGDGPLHIIADRSQIEQVLLNLVVNARDATEEGGRIEIHVAPDAEGPEGTALEGEPCALLEVVDAGGGMTEEVRARVFEPFFTTKSESGGTGLGLSTVHGVVHQSGGQIEVASQLGEGTTFRMHFPIDRMEAARESAESGPGLGAKPLTILVVDDEPSVLRSVTRILELNGYDVAAARGPVEARAVWRQRRDGIDLVLSDVMMPVTNGTELVSEFREDAPDLRAVLMSGFSASTIDMHGLRELRAPLLKKPFSEAELLAAISNRARR